MEDKVKTQRKKAGRPKNEGVGDPNAYVMTDADLAAFLKMSKQTVFNRVSKKQSMPPFVKIGSSRRWMRDEVIQWLRARQVNREVT